MQVPLVITWCPPFYNGCMEFVPLFITFSNISLVGFFVRKKQTNHNPIP